MEVLKAQASEWPEINDFLIKNLRPESSWSLRDEYPLAFSDSNMKNVHVIRVDNKIVAHAVIEPLIIKTPFHLFKVALIGSVVTDPEFRGQGLSKKIINDCLISGEQQGCDFAILWTDLFNFYAQLGFEMAGHEVALHFGAKFKAPIKSNLKILETNKVSAEALLKVYNKHSLRSVRSVADIQKYLTIPNTQVLTAWNHLSNELEAYCVIGKGADFCNYVHEWGGHVSSILSLIQHYKDLKGVELSLITPPQSANLIRQSKSYGADQSSGILGMIKIINPVSFCKKVKKGARFQGYNDFIFDYHEGRYYFGNSEEVYKSDSDQDIIRLCFGPMAVDVIHPFHKSVETTFKEIFPLPFWVWGWDSI